MNEHVFQSVAFLSNKLRDRGCAKVGPQYLLYDNDMVEY